jgi:hypothetical protein
MQVSKLVFTFFIDVKMPVLFPGYWQLGPYRLDRLPAFIRSGRKMEESEQNKLGSYKRWYFNGMLPEDVLHPVACCFK